jgi:MFS family permease
MRPSFTADAPLMAQVFSNIAHYFSHLTMLLYPTVVLVLQREWGMSYDQLLPLALAGQILYGAAALPAGWLGDRWSAPGMILLFFFGTGVASLGAGLARTPLEMAVALGGIGLFSAIYHPVGIAWLVRNARNRGKALGINGIFGSAGVGSAAIAAGLLSDSFGWRWAFLVPGACCVTAGLVMALALSRGVVDRRTSDIIADRTVVRADMVRAFWVLSVTMLCSGLIYQSATVALPKLVSEKLAFLAENTTLVGGLTSAIFVGTALVQVIGGSASDKRSMRGFYALAYLLQAPLYALVFAAGGWSAYTGAAVALMLQSAATPVENGLLARYTPQKWRATAFGAKFVLTLGISAAALPLISTVFRETGGVAAVYGIIAGLALIAGLAGWLLPKEKHAPAPAAAADAARPVQV